MHHDLQCQTLTTERRNQILVPPVVGAVDGGRGDQHSLWRSRGNQDRISYPGGVEGIRFPRSVVRVLYCRSWCVVGVVGAASGRINLPQIHSHTSGVLHGGVSELMALCVCRSLRLVILRFMDGVGEATAAIPSAVSLLLFCPYCYDVVSDNMVEHGGSIVPQSTKSVSCGSPWT